MLLVPHASHAAASQQNAEGCPQKRLLHFLDATPPAQQQADA
jgi:hypothetical protein